MNNRRDFLKKALLLASTAGLEYAIPEAIQKAMAIDPVPGSTFMDAEHVVILMQENRSFDHAFGALQGVRGFSDPRSIQLRNGLPVWFQADRNKNIFRPFQLGLTNTKSTWMGAVPHSRHSQVDAYNEGWYDNWIEAKRRGGKELKDVPLTMGYYNREDIPFNYALADAFTVCDQSFCSAMTSTWPNRYFFWTGTVREEQRADSKAEMRNELPFGGGKWETFPELLEKADIPWKMYQNDLTCGGGFTGEERSWLANFSCNPLERFEKYNVKFSDRYIISLKAQVDTLPKEIKELETKLSNTKLQEEQLKKLNSALNKKRDVLKNAEKELITWSSSNFNKLSHQEKNLFTKAFTTNKNDADYRDLSTLSYEDTDGKEHEMLAPKGDILHQFRQDVKEGSLPAVSWVIPAQRYSDHPSSPWYGSWYISEIMDILTENPEVWQKTIFILTYDENDGYFDHIPPFVPPNPHIPNSGKCSAGIDPAVEYITLEQELTEGRSKKEARGGPIGLGYRVPMIVASPWSKGGKVCSEVFDYTSTLQFLEKFLNKKYNRGIKLDQISDWRRTICGDLTSAFSEVKQKKVETKKLPFINRDSYLEDIHQAQFKELPESFAPLTRKEIEIGKDKYPYSSLLPRQEEGVRESCALPYELYVDGEFQKDSVQLAFKASNFIFGNKSAGAPFTVYTANGIRSYAVKAGDSLTDDFPYEANEAFDIQVHGPNGFFRQFKSKGSHPDLSMSLEYQQVRKKHTGKLSLLLENKSEKILTLTIKDRAYHQNPIYLTLKPKEKLIELIDLKASHHWYDLEVNVDDYADFSWIYAGRIETGNLGYTDPQIGQGGFV